MIRGWGREERPIPSLSWPQRCLVLWYYRLKTWYYLPAALYCTKENETRIGQTMVEQCSPWHFCFTFTLLETHVSTAAASVCIGSRDFAEQVFLCPQCQVLTPWLRWLYIRWWMVFLKTYPWDLMGFGCCWVHGNRLLKPFSPQSW